MTEPETNLSRRNRKKKNRSNTILNILIGVVIVLIITVATTIFFQGNEDSAEVKKPSAKEEQRIEENEDDTKKQEEESNSAEESAASLEEFEVEDESEGEIDEKSGVITYMNPADDYVRETLVDTSWEPIGTIQSGEHVSMYDGESDDWEEKKKALAYATGLSVESMEFWRIKNGGSPQHSIGIVSSADQSEMYRVYLEWVEEQGWKPVKMDVLRTLDFDY